MASQGHNELKIYHESYPAGGNIRCEYFGENWPCHNETQMYLLRNVICEWVVYSLNYINNAGPLYEIIPVV